jgi:pimeloyl-ACP methyl ester carboxylesterase
MTQSTATQTTTDAIRPFTVSVPEEQLTDLRKRVKATIFPEKQPVDDSSQGVQLATIQALAEYWATDYDWRKCEAKLAALPNFMTEIDGLDIHFIHVRSKHEDALPMIATHGWPGSVVEQLKIVGPLTDPTAYGGTESDAFHLVIPSIPGYGFSGKPTATGWGPDRIATAWTTLMNRLGYTKYVAQGGDWGALITDLMAVQAPAELIAIHTNMPGAVPPKIDAAAAAGAPMPEGLVDDEIVGYDHLVDFYKNGLSYAQQMANHPQTLYAIADSPIGLAAWFLDHDIRSYKMITRVFEGKEEGLTRDDVLDNITITWLTNTGVSGARLYRENKFGFFTPKNVTIPVAVSVFPDEIYRVSKRWAEKAYSNLIHFNRLPKGGHFAAWEQPELLTAELREAFKTLR